MTWIIYFSYIYIFFLLIIGVDNDTDNNDKWFVFLFLIFIRNASKSIWWFPSPAASVDWSSLHQPVDNFVYGNIQDVGWIGGTSLVQCGWNLLNVRIILSLKPRCATFCCSGTCFGTFSAPTCATLLSLPLIVFIWMVLVVFMTLMTLLVLFKASLASTASLVRPVWLSPWGNFLGSVVIGPFGYLPPLRTVISGRTSRILLSEW